MHVYPCMCVPMHVCTHACVYPCMCAHARLPIQEKLEAAAESAAALVEQEAARAASVEMVTACVAELETMLQGPQEESR